MSHFVLPEFDPPNGKDFNNGLRDQIETAHKYDTLTEENLLRILGELSANLKDVKPLMMFTAWQDAQTVMNCDWMKDEPSLVAIIARRLSEGQRKVVQKHLDLGKSFLLRVEGDKVTSSIYLRP